MLTALRHQVAQDTNLHFYIFFKFKTLQKFSNMTHQYGCTLLWHWDFTDTPLGFLMRKPIIGLIEFDCSTPESDPAGAFFHSLNTALGSRVIVSDDPTFPDKKPLLTYDHSPATFIGTEEERPGPFYITDELINSGALLTYREAYSAAGKTWFGWWLVEHYLPYHVNCPDGCGLGEPTRGRKDPPYFQVGYGSFDNIADLVDSFVESFLPVQ